VISAIVVLVFAVEGFLIGLTLDTNKWIRVNVDLLSQVLYEDKFLRILTVVISGIFLLTCLSALFSLIKFRRREKMISLKSPYGAINISFGAIEDFIKMLKDYIKGVKELKPKLFLRKGGIKVYIRASLYSEDNIYAIAQDIQNTVKKYLQETVGINNIISIQVVIGKILIKEKELPTPSNIDYSHI
jgi:uncharacterized alkaline shock family protein YloU